VEDELLIRELLAHVLHAERYLVDVAATAADAWRYLRARPYSLVIEDELLIRELLAHVLR